MTTLHELTLIVCVLTADHNCIIFVTSICVQLLNVTAGFFILECSPTVYVQQSCFLNLMLN